MKIIDRKVVEVAIVSDNDGHEYVIPKEEEDEFTNLLELMYQEPESYEDEFINRFERFRAGGAIDIPLYADVDYEKEL